MHLVARIGFAIFLFSDVVRCHVGLTFPPARKYDLDFLDNVRTKPPCGMPKGKTLKKKVSLALSLSFSGSSYQLFGLKGTIFLNQNN
jgi:hypothetical protein